LRDTLWHKGHACKGDTIARGTRLRRGHACKGDRDTLQTGTRLRGGSVSLQTGTRFRQGHAYVGETDNWWHCTPTFWVPVIQADKRKKSVTMQSVRAECARTALIASNALATGSYYAHLHTLVSCSLSLSVTLSLSLSSFLSCAPWWVSALSADARAHCANCEQCACSRDLVYTLAYVGCLVSTCAHAASCVLYRSIGTS